MDSLRDGGKLFNKLMNKRALRRAGQYLNRDNVHIFSRSEFRHREQFFVFFSQDLSVLAKQKLVIDLHHLEPFIYKIAAKWPQLHVIKFDVSDFREPLEQTLHPLWLVESKISVCPIMFISPENSLVSWLSGRKALLCHGGWNYTYFSLLINYIVSWDKNCPPGLQMPLIWNGLKFWKCLSGKCFTWL